MISVTIYSKDGAISGFRASGHALAGQYGRDIVCAAVSAVLQTALLGLTDYAGLNVKSSLQPGEMQVWLPGLTQQQANITAPILETMRLGLQSICLAHPRNLKIEEQEVRVNV